MMMVSADWQLLVSFTVTLYVAAVNPLRSLVFCPVFHKYLYGVVPPVTVMVILPLLPFLQLTLVEVWEVCNSLGSVILKVSLMEQFLVSVTFTMYNPAIRFKGD